MDSSKEAPKPPRNESPPNSMMKRCLQVFLIIIGPFRMIGLYHFDVFSDIYNTIANLYGYCHYIYGHISVGIMVLSYFTTVFTVRFKMKESYLKAIFYPYYHGKYALNNLICSIKAVFNGKDLPSESKMVAIFQHKVQFMEVLSESIPQVALHCLVLSQFGLNTTSIWSASSQLLSLVTSLISICLAFGKQQAFLKNKEIPGIFSIECLKGVAFWIVPLTMYVACLFMMSFSYEASPFLPFSMAAMIHPIVLIPISYLFVTVKELFLKYFSQKTEIPSVIDRIFTMSMTMYLATISGIVCIVFNEWCQYALNHQVEFIKYKEGQQYLNLGNGSTIDSGGSNGDITNLGNVFSSLEDNVKLSKSVLILIATIVLFLFHIIEAITNCNKQTANLHFFLSSYNFKDSQDAEENVTTHGAIPLELLKEEIEKTLLKQNLDQTTSPRSKCNCRIIWLILNRIFLSFLGLFFIITLCCLPHFFYLLEKPDKIEDSWSCKARSGRECHFPFRMKDGNYTNKCEDIGYDNNLRCALRQSNSDQGYGSLTSHGICGDTCPGVCGGEIDKCYVDGTDHCSEDGLKCICKPTYEEPYCKTCKKNIGGKKCDKCVDGFFPFPHCNETCSCDQGSKLISCTKHGVCDCHSNFKGIKCDECAKGFYQFPACKDCSCHSEGTVNGVCDPERGKCLCKDGFTGFRCNEVNQCSRGHFQPPLCNRCDCDEHGTTEEICDENGQCLCKTDFGGQKCDECKNENYIYPNCKDFPILSTTIKTTTSKVLPTKKPIEIDESWIIGRDEKSEIHTIDDDAFLQKVEDNFFCKIGRPQGQSSTYYELVLDCAFQNNQITTDCRKLAIDCLENSRYLQRSILEVFEESNAFEKKNLKRIFEVPFSRMELNLDMERRINECTTKYGIKEQWFWDHTCQNYVNTFNFTTSIRDGCFPTWYSFSWRSKFYMECLEAFDHGSMIQKSKAAIQSMNDIGYVLRDKEYSANQKKVAAGADQVAGPLLYGLGVVLFPSIAGSSLPLRLVGTSGIASGATAINDFRDNNRKLIKTMRQDEDLLKKDAQDLEGLLALYLTALYFEENYEFKGLKARTYDKFKQNVFYKLRAQFQLENRFLITHLDTLVRDLREETSRLIKSTYVGNSNFKKVSILKASTKNKGLSVIQGIKYNDTGTLSTFGQRMKNSRLFRIGGNAVPLLAQFASIGFGIWEIVDGTSSMTKDGISSRILLKARELDHRMASLNSDYYNIVGLDTIQTQHMTPKTELISGIDVYGTENVQIKLKIQSGDSSCTTNLFSTYSDGMYYSAKHTRITKRSLLGNCYLKAIKGGNASINIVNEYGTSLVIDRVDISTNERIVPSVICNATSSITMNSASISRSSLVCQYGKSLHRIKVHTSNEAQSGTSSKILFGLKLKEKTTDMVLHECRSLLLSNHGSEFIRGQIDHFFSNDFGECTDPFDMIAEGTLDPKDFGIEVIVESDGTGSGAAWKVDLIKFYFMGNGNKEKIIYCHPGNGNGDWITTGYHTFPCALKYTQNDERALEAMQVRSCDGSNSEQIQFTFCNININQRDLECAFEGMPCGTGSTKQTVLDRCCRTNKFGYYNDVAFSNGENTKIDGNTDDDDGGDMLGPCEGFEIKGPSVYSYVNNHDSDGWCVDSLWFYTDPKYSLPNGQFGQCSFYSTSTDSSQVLRQHNKGWNSVYHGQSRIDCDIGKQRGLQKLSFKVCNDGSDPGSISTFYATIQNGNKENCTMPLQPNKSKYLPNEYIVVDEIAGECKNLMFSGEVLIWIHSSPTSSQTSDLCLTHFFLDVYDAADKKFIKAGYKGKLPTKYIQCIFNQDAEFSVYFQGYNVEAIPLKCKE